MINGSKIKELREYAGLTQAELGFAAGVSHAQISIIEAGKKDTHVNILVRIADRLGVTVNDLLK